jgi:hypothetical protein
VTLAKAGFAVAAAIVFGTALGLARAHHPGHSKERLRPLAVTPSYLAFVRENLGDAEIIQPALSSPQAATNLS